MPRQDVGGSAPEPRRRLDAARIASFLKSGTGVVTAATALVVALGGLATAVAKFGDGSSPATGRRPESPRATTVLVEGDAQSELRSHIPEQIRKTCGTPVDPEPGAVAAFNCKYREVVGVQYNLFASTNELRAAYAAAKRRYGIRPSGGTCSDGKFEGTRPGGRVLCFVGTDGVAAIVWTDERSDVLSFAWRNDGNLAALAESWRNAIAS